MHFYKNLNLYEKKSFRNCLLSFLLSSCSKKDYEFTKEVPSSSRYHHERKDAIDLLYLFELLDYNILTIDGIKGKYDINVYLSKIKSDSTIANYIHSRPFLLNNNLSISIDTIRTYFYSNYLNRKTTFDKLNQYRAHTMEARYYIASELISKKIDLNGAIYYYILSKMALNKEFPDEINLALKYEMPILERIHSRYARDRSKLRNKGELSRTNDVKRYKVILQNADYNLYAVIYCNEDTYYTRCRRRGWYRPTLLKQSWS